MSKTTILSNKNWFINYCRIRTISFVIAILLLLSNWIPFNLLSTTVISVFLTIGSTLLLTTLLFDYLQTPSFIQLLKLEQHLELRLYIPDTRYLVYFKESAIKSLIIKKGDQLIFRQYKGIISLFDQFDFVIRKKDSTILKTNKINVGWMSDDQKNKLKSVIDQYNIRS